MKRITCLALLVCSLSTCAQSAIAEVVWTVDSSQSFLKLTIPNQPAKINGTPTGNLFLTNQGANSGAWTSGAQSAISGTLSTDFSAGSSIHFRAGEHQLSANNSGSYAPDFDNWNPGTSKYSPANGVDAAAFGGQFNTTQTGPFLAIFNDIYRFAIRDVGYDLGSGVIPLSLNQFNSNATTFGMSDAMLGMRGRDANGSLPAFPSYLDTASALQLSITGTNAAATATITTQPGGQYKLTLPISVPITWTVFGNNFAGTAQGTIVATAVPEPNALVLGMVGVALLLSVRIRKRTAK